MARSSSRVAAAVGFSGLQVLQVEIGRLQLDPKNPRLHPARQVKQLCASIRTFGFNQPILIDNNLNVCAGHGRVLAARQLGWETVPAIKLDHLTPAQFRAFQIADNKLTENSAWDPNLLGEALRDLSMAELDFSLEDIGFSMGEIDLHIEALELKSRPEDRLPDLPRSGAEAVSKSGDLWLLGRHRVLCGSALESGDYHSLMQTRRARAIFTDPPYNVPIDGHVSGLGATRHREFAMASGEMSSAEFVHFLSSAFVLMAASSEQGSLHYIFMDWGHISELTTAGRSVYGLPKNLCVWVKSNGGMGSLYRSQHELIFVFKHGSAPHRNNVELGRHGRNRSNVWEYPGMTSFNRGGEEGNLLTAHPTVKPVALVADAILDCSARGEIILDPFLGSGTTLIAAERTGRKCFGLELDSLYVDTVIRRWQALSGDEAVHAVTGQRFNHPDRAVTTPHSTHRKQAPKKGGSRNVV